MVIRGVTLGGTEVVAEAVGDETGLVVPQPASRRQQIKKAGSL